MGVVHIKLTIIIPVYNEARLIEESIERIRSVCLPPDIMKEIIIIDDGSNDGTPDKLKKYSDNSEIKVFRQDTNMGKTQAVKLGLENSSGDIILIQDADLEYNPNDYPRLLEPFIESNASVVYGSRFKGLIERMAFINRIGNFISNLTCRVLFNVNLTDVNTCYKVFKAQIFQDIEITSKSFTFETEITAKLLKKGYKIYEVPIHYVARTKEEGKKITLLEALRMYWGIIKYRFKN